MRIACWITKATDTLKIWNPNCFSTATMITPISLNTIARLKRDGTRAETRFRLSPKRTSPFKSAEASVQSTAGSRGVRISGSNAGYTTFRGSMKSTGYPLHSPVSPSLPLPCVTVCHQVSNATYHLFYVTKWIYDLAECTFSITVYLTTLLITQTILYIVEGGD